MADIGYVRGQLNGIKDEAIRIRLINVFEHLMNELSLGEPDHQTRAGNFQAYWQKSTTASDTSEFSVAHGLNTTPKFAISALELDKPGSKDGFLEVSRAADNRRIYLKSTSTSAPILLFIE